VATIIPSVKSWGGALRAALGTVTKARAHETVRAHAVWQLTNPDDRRLFILDSNRARGQG
jgi:hypothetical protein